MQQTAGGLKRAASQMTDDEQNDRVRKILSLVKVFLTGTPPTDQHPRRAAPRAASHPHRPEKAAGTRPRLGARSKPDPQPKPDDG